MILEVLLLSYRLELGKRAGRGITSDPGDFNSGLIFFSPLPVILFSVGLVDKT